MPKKPQEVAQESVEQCLATRLRQLSRVVTNRYDADLRKFGVTSNQASVLAVIATLGSPTPSELGPMLMMDASTISRNVRLLLDNEWVALLPGADRRSHRLVISPQGVELMMKVYPAWKRSQKWAKELLGTSGEATVRRLARKVNPKVP